MNIECLDDWFSVERQRSYVSTLMGRGGLTRRRAEYFIRLWAYLLLKQHRELGKDLRQPLTRLYPPEGSVSCTHREAAELFYSHKERGSDRSAGMMIDQFVALGLLEKHFDGQTLCLQIRSLPELLSLETPQLSIPLQLEPDAFNHRTDAVPVANLVARHYSQLIKDTSVPAASHKTARTLRQWSQQYPKCMRVLRRKDNLNPVAVSILYPTAAESEVNFFLPPSKSFFLTANTEVDPFKMAAIGDPNCSSIYVRAWILDVAYMRKEHLCQLLEDTQQTLALMQTDFPNLCDIYSPVVHPLYEELRLALGFQKTIQDPQRSYHWIYMALDRFLTLDIKQALLSFNVGSNPKLSNTVAQNFTKINK